MFQLNPEASDDGTVQVIVCKGCFIDLKLAYQFKKPPPIKTVAYWNLERVPAYVLKLNAAQLIAIAKVVVFTLIFELRAINGARSTQYLESMSLLYHPIQEKAWNQL